MIEAYFHQIQDGLDKILAIEQTTMLKASQKIALAIKENGVIHIFGCGHSHMIAEEVFYRAGGLVPVNPILEESLMLHKGAVRSSRLERQENFGFKVLEKYELSHKDIMIVVSTSGRNPVPIEVAIAAKKAGCIVIVVTSFNYIGLKSRHSSGKHLSHFADLAINNHIKEGDTVLTHRLVSVPFASVSTVHNMAIINSVFAQAIVNIADNGDEPPIFLSGNIDDADEYNMNLINLYKHKISFFGEN